ncbi:hypothetical protein RO3G_04562 [Lichtheimia corymbifera JMRC:FSU:9682]|uniref:Zn(2)-C6 fungal-type domain-containing protein n=1 Tax=Lichtheimia corymbifera JMRC:FSU:9682 TaxID=1263082 RepID=A0A068RWI8_9FUNG|nr:hypothetical protein RO3G_04562 [Lichtheimia corymbifera JMRC:FSU:9682]
MDNARISDKHGNIRNSRLQPQQQEQRPARRPLPKILPMPGSTMVEPAPVTPKRTRAKRSCDLCRKRKTRCNADETWPCSTCKAIGIECNVGQLKKAEVVPGSSSKSSSSYVEALEDRVHRLEGILDHYQHYQQHHSSNSNNNSSNNSVTSADHSSPASCRIQEDPLTLSRSSSSSRKDVTAALTDDMTELSLSDYEKTLYIGGSAGFHMLDQEAASRQKINDDLVEHVILKSEDSTPNQPDFNNNSSFPLERFVLFADIPYMTQQLADAMIQAYFHHVHPYSPMISKIAFLEQYYFQNPHFPDEHLVYAMCACACQFMVREGQPMARYGVTPDTLLSLHQIFRERAEKLLAVVYRRSKISTIQTLILLATFVNTSKEEDDDTLQWFTCGTAQDLGLHRSSSRWRLPEPEIELRRRVWFAAYILDREISAELGRPVTVIDDDYDVELPTPYEIDFPCGVHVRDPTATEFMPKILLDAIADVREKRHVYNSFVSNCILGRILGKVLAILNSPAALRTSRATDPQATMEIEKELSAWSKIMSFVVSENGRIEVQAIGNENGESLCIYYYCMQILLYRPRLGNRDPANIHFALQALSTCTAAAIKIVELVEDGEAVGYICLPWSIVSYSVFQAAMVFLFNAKGENKYFRELGAKYLARCAYIYTKDEVYRESRPAKLLMSLAAKFSVAVDETGGGDQHEPLTTSSRKRDFSQTAEGIANNDGDNHMSSPEKHYRSDPAYNSTNLYYNTTTTTLSMPNQPNPEPALYSQQQQQGTSSSSSSLLDTNGNVLPTDTIALDPTTAAAIQDMAPAIFLGSNGNVQFDLASLSSEIALWNVSSGFTWNDWDPYLQPQQQPPTDPYQQPE